jgi:Carbon-nitrogen hydrolase
MTPMQTKEENRTIRVAIVQASPVPFDLAGTLAKALALLEEAARSGAQLVCFGETFLPGYPAWLDYCPGAALWDHPPVKEVFVEMRMNSVIVPGPETEALAEAAARLQVGIVIGISERVRDAPGHGTLFNSCSSLETMAVYSTIIASSFRHIQNEWSGAREIRQVFVLRRSIRSTLRARSAGNTGCHSQGSTCTAWESRFILRCGRPCTRCTRSQVGTTPSRDVALCSRRDRLCRHLRYPVPFRLPRAWSRIL